MKTFCSRHRRGRLADPSGTCLRAVGLVAIGGGLLLLGPAVPEAGAAPPVRPYPEAVERTRQAASAVLDRSGDEACLRGKLTNALLGLSASCKAASESGELCTLARSAAVVTPMSLRFMDDTSRRLLELTSP